MGLWYPLSCRGQKRTHLPHADQIAILPCGNGSPKENQDGHSSFLVFSKERDVRSSVLIGKENAFFQHYIPLPLPSLSLVR